MLILVTGGSASGKSAHAERLLCEHAAASRLYLATMQPFGAAAEKRIARHRALRQGKGFETVECPLNLAGLELPRRYDGILLEDLGNLLANELFAPAGANSSLASRLPKSSSRMPSYRRGNSSPARFNGHSTVSNPLPCRRARCRAMRFSAAAPKGCMVARYRREAAACSHSSRSACADLPLADPPVTSISMVFPPVSQNLVWSYVSGWYASIPASSKLGMPS